MSCSFSTEKPLLSCVFIDQITCTQFNDMRLLCKLTHRTGRFCRVVCYACRTVVLITIIIIFHFCFIALSRRVFSFMGALKCISLSRLYATNATHLSHAVNELQITSTKSDDSSFEPIQFKEKKSWNRKKTNKWKRFAFFERKFSANVLFCVRK